MKAFKSVIVLSVLLLSTAAQGKWSAVFSRGGYQGTYALGVGYEEPGKPWGVETTLGISDLSEEPVYQYTLKSLYQALSRRDFNEKHSWSPLVVGGGFTYGLGEKFFIFSPDHYPTRDYYPTNAFRALLQVGTRWDHQLAYHSIKKLSIHVDLVTTDAHVVIFFNNSDAITFREFVSLSLSARAHF